LLSALALFPLYTKRGNAAVPVGVLALGLVLYAVLHRGAREARRGGDATDIVDPPEVDLAGDLVGLAARPESRRGRARRARAAAGRFDAGGPG
jgi:hypothetical protein